ncbi:MAG: orotidine 5'-phosphate decarboxylase / HUMPS family protein [Candidatus Hodarchaeota archaeon]
MNELLQNPPYLQLTIDIPNLISVGKFLAGLKNPPSTQLLLEIGSPLLKNEGIRNIVPVIRKIFPQIYLIADLKTLKFDQLEVELSVKTGVDAIVVSGLAPFPIVERFIESCNQRGVDAWVDSFGTDIDRFNQKISKLKINPKVIIIHRGNELNRRKSPWINISLVKSLKTLIAASVILNFEDIQITKDFGTDIFIVGREIFEAENPQSKIDDFLSAIS